MTGFSLADHAQLIIYSTPAIAEPDYFVGGVIIELISSLGGARARLNIAQPDNRINRLGLGYVKLMSSNMG
jgi:hypothetical protein